MRHFVVAVVLLLTISTGLWAQEEARNEVSVQGTGFFTKETTDSGITHQPTHSGGLLTGYRLNVNKWVAVEGNYGYYRNSQRYFATAGTADLPTNVHEVSGSVVFKIPTDTVIKPFLLAGGGALVFDPRDVSAIDQQTRGTFVYGGGADFAVHKNISFRAQYRGLVYKTPDFDGQFALDKVTHSAVPSAGLVFRF